MGIPGLTRKVSPAKKFMHSSLFAGGDFYIDALNFISRIEHAYELFEKNQLNPSEQPFPYLVVKDIISNEIKLLRELKPASITFVFDAMISEEKFLVRMERKERKMKAGISRQNYSHPVIEYLCTLKDVNLVFSGTEAEDEIMSMIHEKNQKFANRKFTKQFVFSSDSDTFRFNIRNKALVFIVPVYYSRRIALKGTCAYKLSETLHYVPKDLVINPPIEIPGITFTSVKRPIRGVLEIINCAIVYKRIFTSITPMWYSPGPVPAGITDVSIEFHSTGIALIVHENLKKRGIDIKEVDYWLQVENFKMKPFKYTLPSIEEANKNLTRYKQKSLPDLAYDLLSKTLKTGPVPLATKLMLTDLCKEVLQPVPVEYPISEEVKNSYTYISSCLGGIGFLEQVSPYLKEDINPVKFSCSRRLVQFYVNKVEEEKINITVAHMMQRLGIAGDDEEID